MSDNNPPSNDPLDNFQEQFTTHVGEERVQSQEVQQSVVIYGNTLPKSDYNYSPVYNDSDMNAQANEQPHSQPTQKPEGHEQSVTQTSNKIFKLRQKMSSRKTSSTQSIIRMSKARSDKVIEALKSSSLRIPKSTVPPNQQSIGWKEGTSTSDTTSEYTVTLFSEMQQNAHDVYHQITQTNDNAQKLEQTVVQFDSFARQFAEELRSQKESKESYDKQLDEIKDRLNSMVQEFRSAVESIRNSYQTLEVNAKNLFTQGYQENILATQELNKTTQLQYEEITKVLDLVDTGFQEVVMDVEQIRDYVISQLDSLTVNISEELKTLNANINETIAHFTQANEDLIKLVQNQQVSFAGLVAKNLSECQKLITRERTQYQNDITFLKKELQFQKEQLVQLQVKSDITYFKCNTLIDNDKLIKEGLQHSSEKVNNAVDLVQNAKNLISQHLQSPLKEELDDRFKDSALSLIKAKKPMVFPDVEKVRSFLKDDKSLVGSETGANLQSRETHLLYEYWKQYETFTRKHPQKTIVFMQHGVQPTKEEDDEEVVQDSSPQKHSSYPQFEKSIPKTKKVVFGKNPLVINTKENTSHKYADIAKEETKFTSPVKSPKMDTGITDTGAPEASIYKDKTEKDPSPGFYEYLSEVDRFNKNRRDFPFAPYMEKKIHKFQFRTQFSRVLDPVIWMMQYESNCDACYFSPQDKCTQMVNVLSGEYLDWFKQRYRNFTGSDDDWPQLKASFLKQYTKPTIQAREELFECKQYPDENLQSYLERLRNIIRTSELDDSHIKDQLVRGMRDRQQRMYVTQIMEYTPYRFDEYTSTTLVEKIEKHTKKFRLYESKNNESKPSTSKPQYFKPRLSWKNKTLPSTPQKSSLKTMYRKPSKINMLHENEQENETSSQSDSEADPHFVNKVNSAFQQLFDLDQVEEEHTNEPSVTSDVPQSRVSTIWVSERLTEDQVTSMSTSSSSSTNPQMSKQNSRDFHTLSDKMVNAMKTHSSKLYSYADKGKELPQLKYETFRSTQHIYLPEKQLLKESPTQFLSAVSYLNQIISQDDCYLNHPSTLIAFQSLISALSTRNANLLYSKPDTSLTALSAVSAGEQDADAEQITSILHAKAINFLCYINVIIQGMKVSAMIDTGSTATIISEKFFTSKGLKVPEVKFYRQCILADGSKTIMSEWNDVTIRVDKYLSFKCDMLISKDINFDMIFGLNAMVTINGVLTSTELKYSYEQNGKRWGTIPLIKVYGPKKPNVSIQEQKK